MSDLDLTHLLRNKRIIICCGSGGVGKTTVSAALGVQGAILGMKVLALTVDPARRLADSLGLEELGNKVALVPEEKFLREGVKPAGRLYAMMLDTKHAFDELITRYAPNAAVAAEILNNRFYQHLSSAMAGSHEYLAMEKLYQIHLRGQYELIILDTPPTKHALDFLDAPNRIRAFFDRSISQWFLKPYLMMGRMGINLFNRTAGTVFRLLERFTGTEFLHDVSAFMTGLADSFDIFRSRADEVSVLLRSESTSFLLVTGTARTALEEATYFHERIRQSSLPFAGMIVNRVHPFPPSAGPVERPEGEEDPGKEETDALISYLEKTRGLSGSMARRLLENHAHAIRIARRDHEALRGFLAGLGGRIPLRTVPFLHEDIVDLGGLLRVNAHLFPPK